MKFAVYNQKNNQMIYKYCDEKHNNTCDKCFINPMLSTENSFNCQANNYCVSKRSNDNTKTFIFCFDEYKVKKQAIFAAKHLIKIYYTGMSITNDRKLLHEKSKDVAVHNTRNISAEINSKLLRIFDETLLSQAPNKIQFIETRLSTDTHEIAREILSIIKSVNQIILEHNIIDLLNPSINLYKSEFGYHNIHTLCVLTFYLYEHEFSSKRIFVKICKYKESCYANYGTIKTALSQMFDNALKYCKHNTTLNINFVSHDANYIDIVFEMTSLYFSNDEKMSLLLPEVRGKQADKHDFDGKGLGLGIINRMIELNRGCFMFESNDSTILTSDNIQYSNNTFTFRLLRNETAFGYTSS